MPESEDRARKVWAARVSADVLAPNRPDIQKLLERIILRVYARLEMLLVKTEAG